MMRLGLTCLHVRTPAGLTLCVISADDDTRFDTLACHAYLYTYTQHIHVAN